MRQLYYIVGVVLVFSGVGQRKKDLDTSAYLTQPNRIEFIMDNGGQDFYVINGREDGLLVVNETSNRIEDGYGWTMHKLDTGLQADWTRLEIIPSTYTYKGWDFSRGYYYMLFATDQYKQEKLAVYRVNGTTGDTEIIELTTVFPLILSHFEVVNNTVVIAGTTNYRPAVLTYDLDERTPRVIPGIYDDHNEIANISIDRENEVFVVSMLQKLMTKQISVVVNTYTIDNLLIQGNLINPGEKLNLIDGAATSFENGYQYISGTYSKKSHQYSRGLYLAKFINGRQQFIKYYNYADLDSFFGYMSENRERRVKERIKKRKSAGKANKFNYRLMIHDIINRDNEYILIGEAYYPRYSSYNSHIPYMGTGYGGYTNVIGYKYTHAIVVSFDQNGNILWDHSFPIEDAYTYTPEEKVTVNILDDRIELLYLEKNLIRSKVILGDKVIEGKSYTPVRMGSEFDEPVTKDPAVEGLEHWFGESLYAFGEQSIAHRRGSGRGTRRVFYINKVKYNLEELPN